MVSVGVEVERITRVKVSVNVEHSQLLESLQTIAEAVADRIDGKQTETTYGAQAMSSVYEKVQRIVAVVGSDKLEAGERILLASAISSAVVAEIIHVASVDGSDASRAAVKADVDRVVAEFLTPVDLPGVPNMMEPFVDMAIATGIRAAVDAAFGQAAEMRNRINEVLKAA